MRQAYWMSSAALASVLLFGSLLMAYEEDSDQAEQATTSDVALDRITYDIEYLSSDELGGRKPGTEGIEMAARYLEEQFQTIGLKPLANGTYRQEFEVRQGLTLDEDKVAMKFVGSGRKNRRWN